MILIKKELAADIFNIIASATHNKYTWQQVNAVLVELQKKMGQANQDAAAEAGEKEFFSADKNQNNDNTKAKPRKKA